MIWSKPYFCFVLFLFFSSLSVEVRKKMCSLVYTRMNGQMVFDMPTAAHSTQESWLVLVCLTTGAQVETDFVKVKD